VINEGPPLFEVPSACCAGFGYIFSGGVIIRWEELLRDDGVKERGDGRRVCGFVG
jgi:hypothetical protein